ncbi:MAG TPA: hypothetical protein VFP34_13160 [Microlunatus sp.]|nr:hypothetical protein [Microlunatus sp.]
MRVVARLSSPIEVALALVRSLDPALTTRLDVENALEEAARAWEGNYENATCRYCGGPIVRHVEEEEATWRHQDRERSWGCRAASFVPDEGGWNEELNRRWYATPSRSTRPVRRGAAIMGTG